MTLQVLPVLPEVLKPNSSRLSSTDSLIELQIIEYCQIAANSGYWRQLKPTYHTNKGAVMSAEEFIKVPKAPFCPFNQHRNCLTVLLTYKSKTLPFLSTILYKRELYIQKIYACLVTVQRSKKHIELPSKGCTA